MNYIARLQGEAAAAHATVTAKDQAIQAFHVIGNDGEQAFLLGGVFDPA